MGQLLLVRHGQASWGSDDYDVLSDAGEDQAAVLGRELASRKVVPDVVLHGALVRQRRTAELMAEAAGWDASLSEDPGWDEMNHLDVLSRLPGPEGDPSPREFQAWFEAATDRWASGANDADYEESFGMFTGRVVAALDRAAERVGDGCAVVVTSGGPISWVVTHLLAAGTESHRRLAPVVVNTSVTKVITGRRGLTMMSFNDHTHLPPGLLTYR